MFFQPDIIFKKLKRFQLFGQLDQQLRQKHACNAFWSSLVVQQFSVWCLIDISSQIKLNFKVKLSQLDKHYRKHSYLMHFLKLSQGIFFCHKSSNLHTTSQQEHLLEVARIELWSVHPICPVHKWVVLAFAGFEGTMEVLCIMANVKMQYAASICIISNHFC